MLQAVSLRDVARKHQPVKTTKKEALAGELLFSCRAPLRAVLTDR
nr:MAG TPA: hypothetical protein [Inoviridae sp.]